MSKKQWGAQMILNWRRREYRRRKASGNWYRTFVFFPRLLQLEGKGRSLCWLTWLDRRYSLSRRTWVWREQQPGREAALPSPSETGSALGTH